VVGTNVTAYLLLISCLRDITGLESPVFGAYGLPFIFPSHSLVSDFDAEEQD
jgi:hypothetical protein